jgi:iron complex outermembrane receptor protein
MILLTILLQAASVVHAADTLSFGQTSRVTVKAPALEATTPAFVTVIKPADLQKAELSLPEILAQTPGVHLQSMGGLGSFTTVSIRGTTAENVRVYLDGVLLNQAAGGPVNLGNVPLASVDRIEIYRGSIPAQFAGSGMGGVVNIITKKTGKANTYDISATGGSFGTVAVTGRLGHSWTKVNYSLHSTYERSDNTYRYLDNNSTDLTVADDTTRVRRNNQYQLFDFQNKVDIPAGPLALTGQAGLTWSERGVPGVGTYPATHKTRFTEYRAMTEVAYRWRELIKDHIKVEGKVYATYDSSIFLDTLTVNDPLTPLDAELATYKQNNTFRSWLAGSRHTIQYLWPPFQTVSLHLEYKYEGVEYQNRAIAGYTPVRPSYRHAVSGTIADDLSLCNEKLRLSLAWHREYVQSASSTNRFVQGLTQDATYILDQIYDNPTIGLLYQLPHSIQLKANSGWYYRMPSTFELFGSTGKYLGNSALKPERTVTVDGGVRVQSRYLTGEMTGFYNRLYDLILNISNERFVKPQNIAEAENYGLEATWASTYHWFKASGNVSWQHPVNMSTVYNYAYYGYILPDRPQVDLFNRMEWAWRAWTVYHEYSYIGLNYRDVNNTRLWPARHLHAAGVEYKLLSDRLKVSGMIKNILDRSYMDLYGYPLPGRQLYLNVSYTDKPAGK